jgi:hypothetical protein
MAPKIASNQSSMKNGKGWIFSWQQAFKGANIFLLNLLQPDRDRIIKPDIRFVLSSIINRI